MSIDYEGTRVLDAFSNGGVTEHYYSYENFDNGTGIGVLFKYPAFISQVVASWENTTTMILSVQLPSGAEYTIKTYSTPDVDSFVLNHRGSGSDDLIYWAKLPANSKLRLGVDSGKTAPGDLTLSIIARPA